MALSDSRRRTLFLLALAVLIACGGVVAVLGSRASERDRGAVAAERPSPPMSEGQPSGDSMRSAGVSSAVEFLAAYLRYERGASRRAEREALVRLSTPALCRQLLRAPVRMPPASAPRREWVSRVEAARVGIFEGRQALLVSVIVVAPGGAHVVTPTLVKRRGRWLVAGLGA